MRKLWWCMCLLPWSQAWACDTPVSICTRATPGDFALVEQGRPAAIVVEANADPAVRHAGESFAADLQRVSGQAAQRLQDTRGAKGPLVLAGVLGHSPLIDGLVQQGKLDAASLAGTWEGYRQVVVDAPFPGVPRALVIVGADRRGTVFGLYDLSAKIGVSPWHWFADVPVKQQARLHVTAGSRQDQPGVRYRGFFINDEAPAFSTWANTHFGGFNARMYAHVFELLLRLKGNTLWPAMWPPHAFNDDDPRNMVLADEMGVVMGTSHHEPMTRAHDEWHRHTDGGITGGAWDYTRNAANLRAFWRGGIERMMGKGDGQGYESLVTIGMRGDGDEAMGEGTAIPLLQSVVADQRRIIAEVTGRRAADTPQVWALYKEVQDYYDHGMTVPDDVTLLFADDNWGQIRRLPLHGADRPGGYGVYYHFDYVGGPRNYKWINTTQIEKTWQQMDLAWQRGARQLWIVNVGDIKPMEFPLSFFMDQAWNPERMTPRALAGYPRDWARATFGDAQAEAIGDLLTRYSQLAARRKPELLDADSFPLGKDAGDTLDGGEFGEIVAEWDRLQADMEAVGRALPPQYASAWFELVEHPIRAFGNLYHLYYAVAWNHRLGAKGDARANTLATQAEAAYAEDASLTARYHALEDGKWQGMMAQAHIGYTTWQEPKAQVMPAVKRVAAKGPVAEIRFAPRRDARGATMIDASRYSRAVDGAGLAWTSIAHLGEGEGTMLALPQGQRTTTVEDGVRLEYAVEATKKGDLRISLLLVPTLDTRGSDGLRVGVSLDDRPVQILVDQMTPAATGVATQAQRDWTRAVIENRRELEAVFPDVSAGTHTLKVWRLDDNVLLQAVRVSQ